METDFDVKDKARIGWVLQSLMQDHQLVDVNFGEGFEPSQSIIVDVDTKKGFFFLDEFPTSESNQLAAQKNRFDLRGALEGVRIKAVGLKVNKVRKDKKGMLYRVEMPTFLMYMQRRDAYRVSIGFGMQIPVDITVLESPDMNTELQPSDHEATLRDISTTGLRLTIPGGKERFSEEQGQMWQLSFKLPDNEETVVLKIETCHARFVSRTRDWQFGCRYRDLDGATVQVIGRFVTEMQRQERRRQNGLG